MKKGYFYLLITFFIYGSIYVANKFIFRYIPPLTMLFMRQCIAVCIMGVLVYFSGWRKIKREHWKYFIVLGVFSYFVAIALQTQATNMMNASIAALINSVNPIFISIFAVIILNEKITARKVLGIICSLLGVTLVLGISGEGVNLTGVAFSLTSVILWSAASVLVRKISADYSSVQITFIGFLLSLPFYTFASYIEMQSHTLTITPGSIVIILYLAVFGSAVSYMLWNKCLTMLDASVCSQFYPLQTLFAALLGIIILNEKIGLNFVLGTVLISGGVIIGLTKRKTV